MPRGMLTCPKHSHKFTQTKIELAVVEEAGRDPFGVLPIPTFSPEPPGPTDFGFEKESATGTLTYKRDKPRLATFLV
jgi:hypothetical protein